MPITVESVLEQAQQLSAGDRIKLAKSLLESIEGDEDIASVWEEQIERRIAKLDAGEAESRSWDEIKQEFELRYGQ
jgi:hypothetical protein